LENEIKYISYPLKRHFKESARTGVNFRFFWSQKKKNWWICFFQWFFTVSLPCSGRGGRWNYRIQSCSEREFLCF
jgi:hypothetical protein